MCISGLPPQDQFIDNYLVSHTGKTRDHEKAAQTPHANNGPYGTKRVSSEETAFKWADTMTKDWLNHIEDVCQEPMNTLGYAKYRKGAKHSDILKKSFHEVWPYL